MSLSRNVLYYGSEEIPPKRRLLRAGPLSLFFEDGGIRYVRFGQKEVVRRVYMAVRDRTWHTLPLLLSNLLEEVSEASFRITFDARNKQDEIDFFWKGSIQGDADGTITFAMDGEARATFMRNRLGLCVLHPIRECAGQACRIEKVDGSVKTSNFPLSISPHQPFFDLQAISHQVAPGLWAEVRFTGDVFETEDQRNWTDASYKTYSTPLRISYPVEVRKGTRIAQSVTLSLRGAAPNGVAVAAPSIDPVRLQLTNEQPRILPSIGLGCGYDSPGLSDKEVMRLKGLRLSHLRVDIQPGLPGFDEHFHKALEYATEIAAPLEIAVTLTDAADEELDNVRTVAERLRPSVARWIIFHAAESSTGTKWVNLARAKLASLGGKAKFGGGSNRYFAELNRGRPSLGAMDFACYPVNPQVHALDNATFVENLEAQAFAVETARQFLGSTPIVVSPVTLEPRVARSAAPRDGSLPRDVDPRQMSLLGAGWTAISLKYVAEAGVESVTYYEMTGWRGVMDHEGDGARSDQFRSIPGGVFPLYHVLADVGEFSGASVVPVITSDPLRADGFAIRRGATTRILVANLGPDAEVIQIDKLPAGQTVRVKTLDESNAESAMRSPEEYRGDAGTITPAPTGQLELKLPPYALARVDISK